MENQKSIFSIVVWDKYDNNAIECPYAYAVVADDMETAKDIAIQLRLSERTDTEALNPDLPRTDSDLSYEITCASDRAGKMYDVICVPA